MSLETSEAARRLARTLHGDVPRIDCLGIVSAAQPPVGESAEPATMARENSRRSIELRQGLLQTFRQIKGQYGLLDNPFLVVNISREEVIRLGRLFGQAAVIHAKRHARGNGGMTFKLISSVGTVLGTCVKVLRREGGGAEARRIEQSEPPDQPPPSSSSEVAEQAWQVESESHGQRFIIPLFDDGNETEFRGARRLNYYRHEIPPTPQIQEALERFEDSDRALAEALRQHLTGRFFYCRRGDHKLRLIALHKSLGNWLPSPMFSWEDQWNPHHHLIRPYSA